MLRLNTTLQSTLHLLAVTAQTPHAGAARTHASGGNSTEPSEEAARTTQRGREGTDSTRSRTKQSNAADQKAAQKEKCTHGTGDQTKGACTDHESSNAERNEATTTTRSAAHFATALAAVLLGRTETT
ncbi:hypothetical protein, conserved in T. vivax [Trypanosoma vivax Y486]|uniref:Trypanosoma vivax n=1 Tax=Trypanosoma vivax (strain Y486) TaxID=1055687 RepID=F9WS00_TRYVY|nr:hypothetical protein, conserved in T. vivax [Trypanosoma vivax Y486]|eukprot:CCD20337.1 hypothetical protein, conserved in T. vivax [Trypanosoma vivax Y486]